MGGFIFLLAKGGGSRIIKEERVTEQEVIQKKASTMKITSSAFAYNEKIPPKYTCDGENVSPPLEFIDIPKDAKSLVLIVDDPDAPSKTWVHWVIYNINPNVSEVAENTVPDGGIEAMTDFGKPGYGGPCPPLGTHRYFFKLYALDTLLTLPQNADKKTAEEAMKEHILGSAELIGLYSRR